MDPFIDEKIILSFSSALIETGNSFSELDFIREAYGPTANEGICFEFCIEMPFEGSLEGSFYIGLDGYTKILLLPYLNRKSTQISYPNGGKQDGEKTNDIFFLSFTEHISKFIEQDFEDSNENLYINPPKICSHHLISLPLAQYRKYMLIFFIKDNIKKIYLGRIYSVVAIYK